MKRINREGGFLMLTVDITKPLNHFTLHVNFTVHDEIVALFGPSGAGKSSILSCIAGLSKVSKGRIELRGRTLSTNDILTVPIQQRRIGYLFQDYALFPHMTVWQNIAYGMKSKTFAHQLMDELQISHLRDMYPHMISGGEKQRVALTRAIATEPDALLLDEPFSALDEDTKHRAHEELLRIHALRKIPVILVTHNHTEAEKIASRMLYIQDGQLTPHRISASNEHPSVQAKNMRGTEDLNLL